jgi:hypothetical protein
MRTPALAALLGLASPAVMACDCAGLMPGFEMATSIVLVRVVELREPSLNPGIPDSPARAEYIEGRVVVLDVLYGERPSAISFEVHPRRSCPASAPSLGETLVVPLEEIGGLLDIGHCTPLLTLGMNWDGWDGRSLALRDVLQRREWKSAAASDILHAYYRWPVPPPPPPPPSGR